MHISMHQDLLSSLLTSTDFNHSLYMHKFKKLSEHPVIQAQVLAMSVPWHHEPLTHENFAIELPYKTTYEDIVFTNLENVNFDAGLTVLANQTTFFPFRPVKPAFIGDLPRLESFICDHSERHGLNTTFRRYYVLSLTGELLYIDRNMLPNFSGVSDFLKKPPQYGEYFGFLSLTPLDVQELSLFNNPLWSLSSLIPFPTTSL